MLDIHHIGADDEYIFHSCFWGYFRMAAKDILYSKIPQAKFPYHHCFVTAVSNAITRPPRRSPTNASASYVAQKKKKINSFSHYW